MKPEYHYIEQLLADPTFHHWVYKTNEKDFNAWEAWIQANPEKRKEVDLAADIIRGIEIAPEAVADELVEQDWKRLQSEIDSQSSKPSSTKRKLYPKLYSLVASVLLFALIGIGIYQFRRGVTNVVMHETSYGETLTVKLPDQSKVYLNAHSKLSYQTPWDNSRPREIELEGEAYFDVAPHPKAINDTFKVKTADVIIQVLGTSFNVATREGPTQVALDAGKVQLSHTTHIGTTIMKPGEWATYSEDKQAFVKKSVKTELYSSWKEAQWIFEATPIEEIAQRITHTYGKAVLIESEELAQRRLSGTIKVNNLDFLLKALSTSFGIQITAEADTIRMGEP